MVLQVSSKVFCFKLHLEGHPRLSTRRFTTTASKRLCTPFCCLHVSRTEEWRPHQRMDTYESRSHERMSGFEGAG